MTKNSERRRLRPISVSISPRLGEKIAVDKEFDRLAPRKPRPLGRGQVELYKNVYLPYREAPPFKAESFTCWKDGHSNTAKINIKSIAVALLIKTIHPILSILSIVSIMHGFLLSQDRFQPLPWLSSCFYDPGVNQN